MECPGLNGLWIACPPTIAGLTATERELFRFLAEPLVAAVVVGVVALLTILVLAATDGLPVGRHARTLPRKADVPAALGHARALREARLQGAAGPAAAWVVGQPLPRRRLDRAA